MAHSQATRPYFRHVRLPCLHGLDRILSRRHNPPISTGTGASGREHHLHILRHVSISARLAAKSAARRLAIPSGRSLAQLITQEIDPAAGRVIELGPGTGVFTRALIGRGVAESDLVLIEKGRKFTGMLAARFPQAAIVESDAAKIGQLDIGARRAPVSGCRRSPCRRAR